MRRLALAVVCLVSLCASAQPSLPDGTWMVSQRIAFDIYPCQNALCGRIAWLRNPTLRTSTNCGRLLLWGLTQDGPAQWAGGRFFDPENGATYDVSATIETADKISARIYSGIALFGKTEILTRIASRSLPGWCGGE
ncbi:MAG TPA: DUF2147 domain-containing protein [Acetobacteraceae bacterium]|nr:DUF2147 domain-containing protein [Acetobacteraceae bacterium]